MRIRVRARSLQHLGYGIYFLALVYAPFAYGCLRPWAVTGLEILLFSSLAIWFTGVLFEFRLPRCSWIAATSIVFILAFGWEMTWNAASLYDTVENAFVPLDQPQPTWPGSVAVNYSEGTMWPLTAVLGAFLVASDMASDTTWRRRLFLTMALSGVALAIFGIVLKVGGPPLMSYFWSDDAISATDFALYHYHANAGAYLNLVWPLALAFAWRSWEKLDGSVPSQLIFMGWTLATIICWAAVIINVSKFALVVFLLLVPIFLILRIRAIIARQLSSASWKIVLATFLLLVMTGTIVYLILYALAPEGTSATRLSNLEEGVGTAGTVDQRILSYIVEENMLGDSDWHGFGPGTFRVEYPNYTAVLGKENPGNMAYAHQDYFQTWIEWGWAGCIAWSILVFGAFLRGWAMYPRRENFIRSEDRLVWLGGCLSLTGILVHALVDFPLQILSLSFYALTFVAILWSTTKRKTPD